MYKLKYDFKQYNDYVSTYLEFLINNSMLNFKEQLRNKEIRNEKNESETLAQCIENVEEYLYYNSKKYPQNINSILTSIINNVRIISVLPINERGIYGRTETKTIYINPELKDNSRLTSEERTRLYMAHELGHVINNKWMNNVIIFLNKQLLSKSLTQEQAQLIYDGFSMLDETISQNRAEEFTYDYSNKKRPVLMNYKNGRLFNGQSYKSNFDFYGELQEPATLFARTLRGIGKENNDIYALNMLSQRALSPDFFEKILNEYSRDNQLHNFILITQNMGLLKRASYANFEYEDIQYLNNSKKYLDDFKNIANRLKDIREPFDNGFSR